MELLQTYVHEFVQKELRVELSMGVLNERDIWKDGEHREMLLQQLGELSAMCVTGELPVTRLKIDHVIGSISSGSDPADPYGPRIAKHMDNHMVQVYLRDIKDRLVDELSTKLFFQVVHAKREFYENPTKGWEQVINRFQDTQSDIEEMGKCFALSRYPAAVFHSLLVVEFGLIDLGREIGVTDPKLGWDATCNKMKQLVDGGHSKYPTTIRINFSSLEQINNSAQTMKHAWRNKVNHAAGKLFVLRPDFTPDVAEDIISATRSFMRTLAVDLPK